MAACPACGHENEPEARFCSRCGTRLAEADSPRREERKIVTVLFADLVGFTQRAEQMDPEDVRAILEPYYARLRAELERFGGSVEKFIGDAVMAVFGAPTAHEDDPERAVRAALAIRDWAEEEGVDLRIGINTGVALVTIGDEPLAAGDVVNTAARLQAGAPVGGILVGGETQRATARVFDYRPLAPLQAKGKAEPVPAWEAIQARARVGVEREARATLVGRDRERSLLWEALERAIAEREPQLVTIVGVPGIGKSRLVYELYRQIEQGPRLVYWRRGRSLSYGEGMSFWALAEMIKAQAGILESDDAATSARRLADAVAALIPDAAERAWLEGHLRPLLGLEAGGTPSSDRRAESFAAWRRFFEAMADERPLVMSFEDLQWAGDDLLDFVDQLVDWASGVPLLVVATARPELLARRPAWGGGKTNALTLRLSPLADSESARLVAELLGGRQVSPEVQQQLIERAEGNPLYAEEFVRLVDEGRHVGDLPATVQGIVAARLDALPTDEKPLVQTAAVVGKVFWVSVLAQVGELDRPLVEQRLHGLERREFVRRERRASVAGETEFTFRHLVIRDVAYGQIPRADRIAKHLAVAGWIESLGRADDHSEMLAHHYLAALELAGATGRDVGPISERARPALRRAGDRAHSLNAFAAAAGFYRRALELWPLDDAEHGRLLLALGGAEYLGHGSGEDHLRQAATELSKRDPERASEAEILLGDMAWMGGSRDTAYEHLERARALVDDAPPSAAKARVLSEISRYHMLADRTEEAIAVGRQALAMAQEFEIAEVEAHALNNIGSARTALGERAGMDDMRRSLEISLRINSVESGRAYNNLAVSLARAGEFDEALDILQAGLATAERFGGASANYRFLLHQRAGAHYVRGEWVEARRLIDEMVGGGIARSMAIGPLELRADMTLAAGDMSDALADAQLALAYAREAKEPQYLLPALAEHALVSVAAGRTAEAKALVDELLDFDPARTLVPSWLPPIVSLAWLVGDLGGAGQFLASLRAAGDPTAWHTLAIAILGGDPMRAIEVAAQVGSRPLEAHVRTRASEQLLRAGRTAEAAQQLRSAIDFWRSVGATRYIEQAEAMLSGAR